VKNLKVTRKLRGQSAPGLRKKLRKTEQALEKEVLERKLVAELSSHLMDDNILLRNRLETRKEIKIGSGMLDKIMDKVLEQFAQEIVRTVMRDDPERVSDWSYSVRHAAKFLVGACYKETSSTFCTNDSFALRVWENSRNQELNFDFKVTDISNHKVLPRHARKAQIMSNPHQRMYLLEEADDYFVGTGMGDKEVKVVGIFR
jgi:hypothetical protein